jgi:crossover junction endodeoxyribonuclease RuvC
MSPSNPVSGQAPRLVLGVDPGTVKLGWGLIRVTAATQHHVSSGVLRPSAKLSRPERLGVILKELRALLEAHRPDAVAVETAFVRRDARAALAIGEARGVAVALAAAQGVAVLELSPSAIKRAVVGGGRATKAQVQEMVRVQLAIERALAEDEADALAAALTGARELVLAGLAAPAVARAARPRVVPPAPAKLSASRAYYAAVVAQARGGARRR